MEAKIVVCVRKLGFTESVIATISKKNCGYNVVACVEVNAYLNMTKMNDALNKLYHAFGFLKYQVDYDHYQLVDAGLEPDMIYLACDDYHAQLVRIVNSPLADGRVFQPYIIISGDADKFTVVFHMSHTIFDFTAFTHLLNELLLIYFDCPTNKTRVLGRPAEQYSKKYQSLLCLLYKLVQFDFLQSLQGRKTFKFDKKSTEITTKFQSFSLDKATTTHILEFCAAHKIHMTGLLYALLISIIRRKLLPHKSKVRVSVYVPSALQDIDRAKLTGCFLEGNILSIAEKQSSLVASAKNFDRLLKVALTKKTFCPPKYFVAHKIYRWMIGHFMISKVFKHVFEISNGGSFNFHEEIASQLNNYYFFSAENHCNYMLTLYSAVIDGRINYTLTYPCPAVDPERAEVIAREFNHALSEIV